MIKNNTWQKIALIQVLLLLLAWLRPLSLPDEGRYSDIGRWMFISNDWLIPRLNGIPFFHKPPLLYWLEAESFRVFGVHVWSARLIPVIHAFMMLVGVYLAVRKVAGEQTAHKATLVLGTSIGFLIGGQYVSHDFLVATWITLSIGLFAVAMLEPAGVHLGLARLGFLACALGFMSKGLIGAVLPGLVIVIWLGLMGRLRRMLELPWLSGIAIFIMVSMPWLLKVQNHFPGYVHYFIVEQHFSRFTGNHFNGQQPWWFYFPVIAIYVFPWGFFVAWHALTGGNLSSRWQSLRKGSVDPWITLAWVWLLVVLVFFSIPRSKLMGYILPVIVPIALLGVHSWNKLLSKHKNANRWFHALCLCSAVLACGANVLAAYNSNKTSNMDTANALACQIQPKDKVYMVNAYAYDIPFKANLREPVFVVLDWAQARQYPTDDWRQTFFEGADFEPASADILQSPTALDDAAADGRAWLISPEKFEATPSMGSWNLIFKGKASWLWQKGNPTMDTQQPHRSTNEHCR